MVQAWGQSQPPSFLPQGYIPSKDKSASGTPSVSLHREEQVSNNAADRNLGRR